MPVMALHCSNALGTASCVRSAPITQHPTPAAVCSLAPRRRLAKGHSCSVVMLAGEPGSSSPPPTQPAPSSTTSGTGTTSSSPPPVKPATTSSGSADSNKPLIAKEGQGMAIVTGAISIVFGVAYLALVYFMDSRGGAMQPPPPEAFL